MKNFLVFIVLFLTGCQTPNLVEQRIYDPTVSVAGGSGIVVRVEPAIKGYEKVFILTANHAVKDVLIPVDYLKGMSNVVSADVFGIWKADEDRDIAVIVGLVRTGIAKPAIISETGQFDIGDKLYASGVPMGLTSITSGIASSKNGPVGIYSGGVTFGNSGGGVFNEKGELVGIITKVAVQKTPATMPVYHIGLFTTIKKSDIDKMIK